MHSNFEWIENKYQPGLFTFYMQEESLNPLPENEKKIIERIEINKRKFRSQIKIPAKYRVNHRYNIFNTTITHKNNRSQEKNSNALHSLRKINPQEMKTQRLSPPSIPKQNINSSKEDEFKQTIKNTNINKYFHYDVNKQRSKMFIYKGQPSNFIKRLSKKLNKNPQAADKTHPARTSTKWNLKTEYNVTDNSKQSINSDDNNLPRTKERLNFLEFLIQRNKQQQTMKSDSNKKRIEMTLTKLIQFNHPKMLQVSQRLATTQQ